MRHRNAHVLRPLLLAAFLLACSEEKASGPTGSGGVGGVGGAAAQAGNASNDPFAACAAPAAVVPYLSTCAAEDGSFCVSAWTSRFGDSDRCLGVIGKGACPTEGAFAACLDEHRGLVTTYGEGYRALEDGISSDCTSKGAKLCRVP